MPKYLSFAKYTPEGIKGLLKTGGTARREAVEAAITGVGGRVESFYFAFGEHDAVVLSDAPDNLSVAAVSLAVGASGLASVETVALLTPEEVDQAVKKTVSYRAPGQ